MYTLSTTAFEVLWEALALPAMPVRIAVDRQGATPDERARVREAALAEADRLGLGRPPHLDRELTVLLDALARYDRAIDLRELGGPARTAVAAARGRRGVLAVLDGGRMTVAPIGADHLVTALLGLLPAAPPGTGRACSVPTRALDRAMRALAGAPDSQRARAALHPAGVRGGDVEQLLRIATTTTGSGSIGVYRAAGPEPRLAGSLAYVDTHDGRYLVLTGDDRLGDEHTTVLPATADALRHRVRTLLSAA